MNLKNCHNFADFRKLAKKKLPSPIFHYIDGGSDDESTLRRNTDSFNDCDLVPNILASVGKPDLSTTLFGRKIDLPIFLSPAAMQRLYLYALAAAGQLGVERALELYKSELVRDMKLMGCTKISDLNKNNN